MINVASAEGNTLTILQFESYCRWSPVRYVNLFITITTIDARIHKQYCEGFMLHSISIAHPPRITLMPFLSLCRFSFSRYLHHLC